MMNCQEFKQWLVESVDVTSPPADGAQDHLQQCPACLKLYEKDRLVEDFLNQNMRSMTPPPGLVERVRFNAESRSKKIWFPNIFKSWKMAAPVFASIILLVVVWNPFSSQLQTIDDVVIQGLAFHRHADLKMEFTSNDVADPGRWFTQKLGYNVKIPDLDRLGLSMVGGRKCRLGKVDAAYLQCKSSGKRASLFLIDPNDIGFDLHSGREYRVMQDGTSVTVWRDAGVVLALVL